MDGFVYQLIMDGAVRRIFPCVTYEIKSVSCWFYARFKKYTVLTNLGKQLFPQNLWKQVQGDQVFPQACGNEWFPKLV